VVTLTRFQRTGISDVNLSEVNISDNQVKSAFGDASVTLPEDMDRPAHWPDWELPQFGDSGFYAEWRKWRDDPEGYTPPPKPEG